jgi:hypothetical protein
MKKIAPEELGPKNLQTPSCTLRAIRISLTIWMGNQKSEGEKCHILFTHEQTNSQARKQKTNDTENCKIIILSPNTLGSFPELKACLINCLLDCQYVPLQYSTEYAVKIWMNLHPLSYLL